MAINTGTPTTLEAIKAAGLKKSIDVVIDYQHAVTYTTGGPDAKIEAVAIFTRSGVQFFNVTA